MSFKEKFTDGARRMSDEERSQNLTYGSGELKIHQIFSRKTTQLVRNMRPCSLKVVETYSQNNIMALHETTLQRAKPERVISNDGGHFAQRREPFGYF